MTQYRADNRTYVKPSDLTLISSLGGKRWKITGFGQLRHKRSQSGTHGWFIEVYLTSQTARPEFTSKLLSTTFLPALAYGKVFDETGRLEKHDPESNISIDIDVSTDSVRVIGNLMRQTQCIIENTLGINEESSPWVSTEQLSSWGLPEIYGSQNCLLVTARCNGSPIGVLIPCTEMLRFYYCTSSRFLKAILSGCLQENRLSQNIVFINDQCTFDIDTKHVTVRLNRKFCPADASLGARFYGDIVARTAIQNIRRSYAVILQNHLQKNTPNESISPVATFPFNGHTNLALEGSWVKKEKLLFVHRIDRCTGLYPCERLSYSIVGDTRDQKIQKPIDNPPQNEVPECGETIDVGDTKRPATTIEKASKNRAHVLSLTTARFAALSSVRVTPIVKVSIHTGRRRTRQFVDGTSYTTADEGTSAEGKGSTPIQSETDEMPPLCPDEIERLKTPLGRILILAERLRKQAFKIVAIDPCNLGLRGDTFSMSCRPMRKAGAQASTRTVCVLEVERVPACFFYLLDMGYERKLLGRYLMVWNIDLHKVPLADLKGIVTSSVELEKWDITLIERHFLERWFFNHRGSGEKELPRECRTVGKRIRRICGDPWI